MSNREESTQPCPGMWDALNEDQNSPLHRLFRLQSLLRTAYLALRYETSHLGEPDGLDVLHIETTVTFAAAESEMIGGELEVWLCDGPPPVRPTAPA